MATSTFGRIEEFNSEAECIASYLERIDHYFLANVVSEVKQVPVFLSVVGGKSYELLRNFCTPPKPKDKRYQELKDLLKGHFEAKPSATISTGEARQRESLLLSTWQN